MKILHSSKITTTGVYQDDKCILELENSLIENDNFYKSIYKFLNPQYKKFHKMDNYSKLAFLLNEILIKPEMELHSKDVAVVLSNKSGSSQTDLEFAKGIVDSNNFFPSPAKFVYTLPNIMIGEICIRNKIFGENAFFIQNSYDKTKLLNYADIICGKSTKYCITGWVEPYMSEGILGELLWIKTNN